jgi:two-component sensor histidine kinase
MDEFNDPYIDELLAGPSKPKPQVTANLLRKSPQRQTTSVPGTVAGQESVYGYTPVPQVTPHPHFQSQGQKPVPGYQTPTGVSSLRGDQVQSAQQQVARDQAEMERLQQPGDYSGMQAQMREQGQSGQRALLLALAAQEAGKEFAPVQGAFLKRAMEARQPMKTATGYITETGEHIEDPMAKAEQKMKLLQARVQQNQQIIQSAATAEEKAEAQRQTAADQMEMKKLMIQSQQSIAAMTSAASAASRGGAADDRRFRGEDRMKNDFEQVTKSPREGYAAAQQVRPLLAGSAGRKLSNVEQQALITLFNKFLDPTSVVREGEFNRMAQGMGLGQRVQNWQDKILSGSIITPQMVQEIGRVAQLYEQDAVAKLQQQAAEYQNIASQRGYDPSAVIADPRFRGGGRQGPPPGAVVPDGAPAAAAQPNRRAPPPPGAVQPL